MVRTMLSALCVLALILGGLSGCTTPSPAEDEAPVEPAPVEEEAEEEEEHHHDEHGADEGVVGMMALAVVVDGEGQTIGEVRFTQTEEGVAVEGRIEGQEPGPKGFHVHETGLCEPPDFMSAGGHFNPEDHPHGGPDDDPDYRHAGDFGNLDFDDDGVAEFSFVDPVVTLGSGVNNIVGQALIVHFEEDDLTSQPVGEAGGRAGCGLIEEVESF